MHSVRDESRTFETIVLRDHDHASRVDVVPVRGGIVTRFEVDGRDVLFLDESTLVDPSKNIRGGIPVLFPIAGRLADDVWKRGERSIAMKQHGFARNATWLEVGRASDQDARVTLALGSSASTREAFPWEFEFRLTYVLKGASLALEAEFENRSEETMPLHAGFHPYFRVPDALKSRATISTDATRAFDNTSGRTEAFAGFDLERSEVDLHLLDHHARTTRLHVAGEPATRIDMDSSFTTLVVWTLAGKDYVCVEPWTAPGNAMNTGTGLLHVAPGATRRARFAITVERPAAL